MLRTFEAMTTPMTTLPPTTPPPLNAFYLKYAASQHRQDKKLEAKPLAVVRDVSRIHCLSLCLQRQTGGKSKICRSFNWADRTCYMLNTYVCDGEKELTVAPGYSYFDLVDSFAKEVLQRRCPGFLLVTSPWFKITRSYRRVASECEVN
ncbi:c-type lectin domain-containing protein [Trichonephila clavipes]|nr:c-type lectin domain-containing protein [Trichonephila clavipes]